MDTNFTIVAKKCPAIVIQRYMIIALKYRNKSLLSDLISFCSLLVSKTFYTTCRLSPGKEHIRGNNVSGNCRRHTGVQFGYKIFRYCVRNSLYVSDTEDNVATFINEQCGKQSNKTLAIFKRICALANQSCYKSGVLLVGCGPRRLWFELSAVCDKVIACDTSSRCKRVKSKRTVSRQCRK
ncbi:uncharacterized protein LOC143458905 [Clavelina lepadiformis]|uniref:uncharacterized protein LOC143458905 n=1 Tax=Clavelina lepadiformis TaxID=159417 RepID=UPI0040425096